MNENKAGPLFPKRGFDETKLEFAKVKLRRSGTTPNFSKSPVSDDTMTGAICAIQVILVPNRLRGIEYSEQLIATAFFVAPGVAITAWHVFKDFLPPIPASGHYLNAPMPAEFQVISPLLDQEVIVWPVGSFSVGTDTTGGSDLTAIGCHVSGNQPKQTIHHCLELSTRFPVIGEKLFTLGLKEHSKRRWRGGPVQLEVYESAGTVIDVYPKGRGQMPHGPCFAIDSGATGGMSGAPVFDQSGLVVGVLTSGTDDRKNGYAIVSSVSPVLDHKTTQTWRSGVAKNLTLREIIGLGSL